MSERVSPESLQIIAPARANFWALCTVLCASALVLQCKEAASEEVLAAQHPLCL